MTFWLLRFSSNSSFVECKRSATDITPQLKLRVLCALTETVKEPIFVEETTMRVKQRIKIRELEE